MVTDTPFMHLMFEKVQKLHQENPFLKDRERLKSKVIGVQSQIEVLAERLSELPRSVSPQPIYRQLEKLEAVQKEYGAQLAKMKEGKAAETSVASKKTFESFAVHYNRFVHQKMDADQQKRALQKFIHRVEVARKPSKSILSWMKPITGKNWP